LTRVLIHAILIMLGGNKRTLDKSSIINSEYVMKKTRANENLLQSFMLDNDVAVPCGANLGYVKNEEWSVWFPQVAQHNAGVPSEPNKNKLSVWNNGRGPFVDSQYGTGEFFDIKMKSKMPKFFGMKQELWSGSPSLEKRANFIDQTDEEVVAEFISNQNDKQIVRSLKGLDDKPYLVMFAWQETNTDGTWDWKCVCVNATKYLKVRAKTVSGSSSKSDMSGLIYRAKRPSQNSEYCDSSASARVEFKSFNTLEELIVMGVATEVSSPLSIDWTTIM